jgi:hypothetical protein
MQLINMDTGDVYVLFTKAHQIELSLYLTITKKVLHALPAKPVEPT